MIGTSRRVFGTMVFAMGALMPANALAQGQPPDPVSAGALSDGVASSAPETAKRAQLLMGGPSLILDMFFNHEKSSPWQNGFGLRVAHFWPVFSSDRVFAGPAVTWIYSPFDGGHDNYLNIGAQLRRVPDKAFLKRLTGLWYGAEVAFSRISTANRLNGMPVPGLPDESYNGVLFAATGGSRLFESGFGQWSWMGLAGMTSYSGDAGVTLQIGIELQIGKKRP